MNRVTSLSGFALVALFLSAAGCFAPELGPAPFLCSATGGCPGGYLSTGGVCLQPGVPGGDGGVVIPDVFPDLPLLPDTPGSDLPLDTLPPDVGPGEDRAVPPDSSPPQDRVEPPDVPPPADVQPDLPSTCTSAVCRACEAAELLATPPAAGGSMTVSGTTSGTGLFEGRCAFQNGPHSPLAPEALYRLDLPYAASIEADTLLSDIDTVLYVRSDCQAGADLACNDDDDAEFQSAFTTTLQPGTYYFFVDGYAEQTAGAYTLRVNVTPL